MIKLCIANRKGGVSKTTTAVNLSSILSELGHSVLLIDLDAQGDASDNMGFDVNDLDDIYTTYDVMTGKIPLRQAISKTDFNVDMIPTNSRLAESETELSSKMNREKILSDAIEEANLDYDFIIFDLPPNLGLLSINGLVASDSVVVTVDVGRFSLSGISDLLEIISLIRKSRINSELDILGVLMTKVNYSTRIARTMQNALEEIVGNKVFKTKIRQNVTIADGQSQQKPINFYDRNCNGHKEYVKFAKEVLENVKRQEQ